MNILLTAAEVFPFAKAGGLADVASYLPKEWEKLGHTAIIVMPKYGHINTYQHNIQPTDIVVSVPMGQWTEYARLWRGTLPDSNVSVYFLENADYFDRQGIYGNPEGFLDNDRRFIFLSRAIFEVAKAINFSPDIIHANDYHTAFALAFLKIFYRWDPRFSRTAGVYTIHNMVFQGQSDAYKVLPLAGIPINQFYPYSWFENAGVLNMMKVGIMFAEKVTTVSPRYAMEIRYSSQGYGLQKVLNDRGYDVIGILNGVDYDVWNPETDDKLYANYTLNDLSGKRENKVRFLEDWGLTKDQAEEDIPLIGLVARLTDQKGIELIEESLEWMVYNLNARFVLCGSGAEKYENFFRWMSNRFPTKVLTYIGYNDAVAHRVEAASDMFLMPSLFEPCGLNQMYSLKYGTVPIVRQVGGLADTVFEYSTENPNGNGFTFVDYNQGQLIYAIMRAIAYYNHKDEWSRIIHNGMTMDLSAIRSASRYIEVFRWAKERIGG